MNGAISIRPLGISSELLTKVCQYLTCRERDLSSLCDLERIWSEFYELYSRKIRRYAFACGTPEVDIADCVQEVWRELLVRLPSFRLDPRRGQFDTWVYCVVKGKTADLRRSRKRRLLQGNADNLDRVTDCRSGPMGALEQEEIVTLAWGRLKRKLSTCNFQVLQLRLVEQRAVAEVAETLGLSQEQVWYRYHRARRVFEEIGAVLARCQPTARPIGDRPHKKKGICARNDSVLRITKCLPRQALA
jgi:RNA polymerase sigma factor (sigma-70 family)